MTQVFYDSLTDAGFSSVISAPAQDESGRLPTETSVVNKDGCYASISVGEASTKLDASAKQQAVVLRKLKSILSCLPS